MARVRLQKLLADAGVASRRASEKLIQAGRVAVNGTVVTQLGSTVDPDSDHVALDGEPVSFAEPKKYLLLHKPKGYLSTAHDERGRPTVMDLIGDVGARVYPVGRLDKDSEGMLLLTNDGDLALRLMHPSYEVEKEYLVRVHGQLRGESLDKIKGGVDMGGRHRKPLLVETAVDGSNVIGNVRGRPAWLRIVLREGYKREIRELCKAAHLWVGRLVRVRIGRLTLGDLPVGTYRELNSEELAELTGSAT